MCVRNTSLIWMTSMIFILSNNFKVINSKFLFCPANICSLFWMRSNNTLIDKFAEFIDDVIVTWCFRSTAAGREGAPRQRLPTRPLGGVAALPARRLHSRHRWHRHLGHGSEIYNNFILFHPPKICLWFTAHCPNFLGDVRGRGFTKFGSGS